MQDFSEPPSDPGDQFAQEMTPEVASLVCRQPLAQTARRGLELYNQGDYFAAHEYLEEAWRQDKTPGRELYRAVLQIAVAYLQIERGNYAGAVKMFQRAQRWLAPFPDDCRGIDLARLRADSGQVYQRLIDLGPDRIHEFNRGLFKPVLNKTKNHEQNEREN